jgi:hypothetical protein
MAGRLLVGLKALLKWLLKLFLSGAKALEPLVGESAPGGAQTNVAPGSDASWVKRAEQAGQTCFNQLLNGNASGRSAYRADAMPGDAQTLLYALQAEVAELRVEVRTLKQVIAKP